MNPNGPGRGPRGLFWLLPLLIGVALGGLFFGGGRGGSRFDGPPWARYEESVRALPPQAVQPAQPPQPPQPQVAPQAPDPRFEGRGQHFRGGFDQREFGRHDHDWGFFPFGGLRLLIPLLLIGAGAWLLSGRRGPRHTGGPGGPAAYPGWQGGPGQWTAPAPQPGQPATPPPAGPYTVPPTPPVPPTPNDPPTSGETRVL